MKESEKFVNHVSEFICWQKVQGSPPRRAPGRRLEDKGRDPCAQGRQLGRGTRWCGWVDCLCCKLRDGWCGRPIGLPPVV